MEVLPQAAKVCHMDVALDSGTVGTSQDQRPAVLPDQVVKERGELCRKFHVAELGVSGSANTDKFDPERSNIDLLVDFKPQAQVDAAKNSFGLRGALENLFGRKIDLLTLWSIENPFLQRSIERSYQLLYPSS